MPSSFEGVVWLSGTALTMFHQPDWWPGPGNSKISQWPFQPGVSEALGLGILGLKMSKFAARLTRVALM